MNYEDYKKRLASKGETLEDVIKKKSQKRRRDTKRLIKYKKRKSSL